jgi:hypothetical protein
VLKYANITLMIAVAVVSSIGAGTSRAATHTVEKIGSTNSNSGHSFNTVNDADPGCGQSSCENLFVLIPRAATIVAFALYATTVTSYTPPPVHFEHHPCWLHSSGQFWDCNETDYFRFYPGTLVRHPHDTGPNIDYVGIQARSWGDLSVAVKLVVTYEDPGELRTLMHEIPIAIGDEVAPAERPPSAPSTVATVTTVPIPIVTSLDAEVQTLKSTAVVHRVRKGESLGSLARVFYGASNKWTTIYEANKTFLGAKPKNGRRVLPEGIDLSIPTRSL